MTSPPQKKPATHLRPSDARAIAQLATQATMGVARMAEGVHQSVLGTLGARAPAPGRTGGITGLVYGSVRGFSSLVGKGIDVALRRLQPTLEAAQGASEDSPQRAAVLAAFNGVLGDHLAAQHNPLAMPMTLRCQGRVLDWQAMPALPQATGKLLLFIHGLCMNDLQWRPQDEGVDYASALAAALGCTPVYLRYNTGLHTSQNGRELSALLQQLVQHWPVPVQEISIVAHSMGGLVARSAAQCAEAEGAPWRSLLRHIVFLGTPHHGAPLERAGNWVDVILGSTPYSAPFAKLGQLRSAGITDLRYGHVLDADWLGHDRFRRKPDRRRPVPLPAGVACHTVAATVAASRSPTAQRLLGDGLVPLRSALGQHDDPARCLAFPRKSQLTVHGMNHMQLLHSARVLKKMLEWLGDGDL